MLAEIAGVGAMNPAARGLDDLTMQRLWAPAKNDVDRAAKLASLCRSEKWLRKLAKDRRVKLRQVVYANPACPLDVLDTASTRERSWDTREAANRAIDARVPKIDAEVALALVRDGMSEKMLDAVVSNPKLSDADVLRLIGMTVQLSTRSGGITNPVEVAKHVASRCNLQKRPDEVLFALATAGVCTTAAQVAVLTKRADVCRTLLAGLASLERHGYQEREALRLLARAPGMERSYYEQIVSLKALAATSECGANRDCPWDVLADIPARDTGVHALGRALVELDAPQETWRLVVELCEQNHAVTVAEVLALVHACS